jgi:oxaloacetate decarboxylase alpha subunit
VDILRIFDALNDLRNIEIAVDETRKRGAHAQGAIAYTISPIHSLDSYAKLGRQLEEMGASSICIKDMAGILGPKDAYDLISALKSTIKIPVFLHTHSTTGLAYMTYLKSAEAGCDGIDTAISAFSGGTSQPATESMHYALQELGIKTGLYESKLKAVNDFFKPMKDKYLKSGLLDPYVLGTETDALVYQVPGGMLSNMMSQLKAQNARNRFDEVLKEIPNVRRELGYPPLVTPMSQMVGTQAVMNVLAGERYKMLLKEVKAYIRGEYGKAPGEIDEALKKAVLGDTKPLAGRFSDTLEPLFVKTKSEAGGLVKSDRDVLSYILFPQVYEAYVKEKQKNEEPSLARSVHYSIAALQPQT